MSMLAAIAFDPAIRGILVVAIGVVVLIGSVYLLLATNTGIRQGLLITLAGLAGWCSPWVSSGRSTASACVARIRRGSSWRSTSAATTQVVTEVVRRSAAHRGPPRPGAVLRGIVIDGRLRGSRTRSRTAEGEGFVPETLTQLVTLVPEQKSELDEELNELADPARVRLPPRRRRGRSRRGPGGQPTRSVTRPPAATPCKDVYFFGGKGAAEPETVPGEDSLLEQAWNRIVHDSSRSRTRRCTRRSPCRRTAGRWCSR